MRLIKNTIDTQSNQYTIQLASVPKGNTLQSMYLYHMSPEAAPVAISRQYIADEETSLDRGDRHQRMLLMWSVVKCILSCCSVDIYWLCYHGVQMCGTKTKSQKWIQCIYVVPALQRPKNIGNKISSLFYRLTGIRFGITRYVKNGQIAIRIGWKNVF